MLSDLHNLPSFRNSGFPGLIDWARGRGISFGLERSVRIRNGNLETHRCLLSFVKISLEDGVSGTSLDATGSEYDFDPRLLFEICRLLRCPDKVLESIARFQNAARFIHFGFEDSATSTIVKCYLELPPIEPAFGTGRVDSDARIQFFGYKWNMANSEDAALTVYRTWLADDGHTSLQKFLTETPALFQSFAASLLEQVARSPQSLAPQDFTLLEVRDEGSPRCSWDLNIYDTGLTIGQLADSNMLPESVVDEAQIARWRESVSSRLVGHVATGHDRHGTPFLTIYYGGAEVG
ncbi:MAG: hypothetical protein JNM43_08100 [Planctomycetaceae bacterium]|nr:hypothetical protein [Planctomycetaceae bacterium]